MGRRVQLLRKARLMLEQEIEIIGISSIYHTAPRGFKFQPSFLNQVISGKTTLSPAKLLEITKKIERKLGRIRLFPNAPRMIDIDLLFYNNLTMNTDKLTIPHPRVEQRAFCLVPLAEIAAGFIHPVTGRAIHRILSDVDTSGVRRWS